MSAPVKFVTRNNDNYEEKGAREFLSKVWRW